MAMKRTRVYLAIIIGIALLCALALLLISRSRRDGDRVEVLQGGELLYTLPLDQDTERTIPGKNGGENTLIIQDGAVWMAAASCPDQICVRHGPSKQTADPITCLPNQLTLRVIATGGSDLDGVTG